MLLGAPIWAVWAATLGKVRRVVSRAVPRRLVSGPAARSRREQRAGNHCARQGFKCSVSVKAVAERPASSTNVSFLVTS